MDRQNMSCDRKPHCPAAAGAVVVSILVGVIGCAERAQVPILVGSATPDVHAIPTRDAGDFLLIETMLNKRGPYLMLLDTGASISVLDVRAASEITGRPAAPDQPIHLDSVQAGSTHLASHIALVRDLGPIAAGLHADLAGILGYSAFNGHLLTIDFLNRTVRVEAGALPLPDGERVFPLARANRPFLTVDIAGHPEAILLDTGASTGLLLHTDLRSLPLASPPRSVTSFARIDGVFASQSARLDGDVVFGPSRLRRPIVSTTPDVSLVGVQVLKHFVLTFDAQHRRIRLTPAHDGPIDSPPVRRIGAAWAPDAGGWRVMQVSPDGPADKAGLRPGDVIHSINGRLIRSIGTTERREFTSEQPTVLLEIIRDGERFAVEVATIDVIP